MKKFGSLERQSDLEGSNFPMVRLENLRPFSTRWMSRWNFLKDQREDA